MPDSKQQFSFHRISIITKSLKSGLRKKLSIEVYEILDSSSPKGPFVNYVSISGYLVGQKRAIFAYF